MEEHVKLAVHRINALLCKMGAADRQAVYDAVFPEGRPVDRRSGAAVLDIGASAALGRVHEVEAMGGETDVLRGVARLLRSVAMPDSYRADPEGWAEDVLDVHLWSKQAGVSRSVRDNKRTVVASCHGTGKALALDTPL